MSRGAKGSTFLLLLLWGIASPAWGAPPRDNMPLYHLSADSTLRVKRAILVPANTDRYPIGSSENTPLSCFIRLQRPQSFDRVIQPGRRLIVIGTERGAVSAKNQIYQWTRLRLKSESVEDILCSMPKNSGEPKIRDFKNAVGGVFDLEVLAPPIEIN